MPTMMKLPGRFVFARLPRIAVVESKRLSSSAHNFDKVIFYGRSLEEYENMFMVNSKDLVNKKVLDCPGGPSLFNMQARAAHGVETISIDPMYEHNKARLEVIGRLDIDSAMKKLRAMPDRYPGFTNDIEDKRIQDLNLFLLDYESEKPNGRYVPAYLPHLPFKDNYFDIALCGYLLFAYAPVQFGGLANGSFFDLDWHRRAVDELLRSTKAEIRIFPAQSYLPADIRSSPYNSYALTIARELEDAGVAKCTFFETRYSGASNTDFALKIVKL